MRGCDGHSLRSVLVRTTGPDHDALHHHDHISRLSAPDLRLWEYRTLLTAYRKFYDQVEQSRAGNDVYEGLSLRSMILALDRDLEDLGLATAPPDPPALNLSDAAGVLGALYVLHGAGFGGQTLAANVHIVLPFAPSRYLSTGTGKVLWRNLIDALESNDVDQLGFDDIIDSATKTFRAFGTYVTQTFHALPERDRFMAQAVSGAA